MFVELEDLRGVVIHIKITDPGTLNGFSWNGPTIVLGDDAPSSSAGTQLVRRPWEKDTFLYEVEGNLKMALEELEIEPWQAVFITSVPEDVPAARLATQLSTVFVGNQYPSTLTRTLPDVWVPNLQAASAALTQRVTGGMGWVAEARAHYHRRSMGAQILLGNKIRTLGRYFSVSDRRHPHHLLTQRILTSKHRTDKVSLAASVPLASALLDGLLALAVDGPVTAVVPVPTRPGESEHGWMRELPAALDSLGQRGWWQPHMLEVISYPSQKGASPLARRENVQGVFSSRAKLQGQHIVLVDDIITTGQTIEACRATLARAGASSVSALVLACSQKMVGPRADLPCPRCGGQLKLRFSGTTGRAFWGCQTYPACTVGLDYLPTARTLNTRLTRASLDDTPPIPL